MNAGARPGRPQVKSTECSDDSGLAPGDVIQTACGGILQRSPQTACLEVNGETVYFCLEICKKDFLIDPRYSCLAHRYK